MNDQNPTPKPQRTLSDKQVHYAINTRKPMFLKDAKELVTYLEQQNDPQWWMNRSRLDMCTNSFIKMKRDKWYEQNPDKRPIKKQGKETPVQQEPSQHAPVQQEPSQHAPVQQEPSQHAPVQQEGATINHHTFQQPQSLIQHVSNHHANRGPKF